jgi:CO/xanthine dehydrogenase FAD-binding subunit
MAEAHNNPETDARIFYPASPQELFTAWARFPGAVLCAGAAALSFHRENGCRISLPAQIISLIKMDELRRFSRTERYLEIGAMVRLAEIINMGKIVPGVFTRALNAIGGPQVRNIATIGGHICCPRKQLDAVAPLIALDARYELRSASAARWIPASRFSSIPGPPPLGAQEILTRIRIPLDSWNYSAYKKFTDPYTGDGTAGSMAFLARFQKKTLADIRIVYAGRTVIRDKNSEAVLTGRQLPLTGRDSAHFMEQWAAYLSAAEPDPADALSPGAAKGLSPLMRAQMLNFVEACIRDLAE